MEREAREVRERTSIARRREQREQQKQPEAARQDHQEEQRREWRGPPQTREQAHTIPYSLARALRALAGGLSWERLGRIALLENASEILSLSLIHI